MDHGSQKLGNIIEGSKEEKERRKEKKDGRKTVEEKKEEMNSYFIFRFDISERILSVCNLGLSVC